MEKKYNYNETTSTIPNEADVCAKCAHYGYGCGNIDVCPLFKDDTKENENE